MASLLSQDLVFVDETGSHVNADALTSRFRSDCPETTNSIE
jgi:hypothetical protein